MIDAGLWVFARLVAHAWIAKIQGPPPVVNGIAWVSGLLLTLIVVVLVLQGLVR
jgi:hypothetical protein